jgi:hypothetical protein
MIDPDSLDFSSGKELITGKCKACKGDHHAYCSSDPDVMLANRADIWPLLDEDGPENPTWRPEWVCGCFKDDRDAHPNGDWWDD